LFFFLKKKPFLRDLLPDGYTDIHSHLLPGIDDGAKNLDETISLAGQLSDIGISQFVTTPHIMSSVWENTAESIRSVHAATVGKLSEQQFDFRIRPAAEYMIDSNFVRLLQTGELLTLKDKHVLIEMSYLNPPLNLYEVIFDLQLAGYVPVLAHPERYAFYAKKAGEYEKLKNAGCKFQLNLLSVVGYYGTGVTLSAKELLQSGLIDFVGSDVHHQNHIRAFSKRILIKDAAPLRAAMQQNSLFSF
jgi:tyrosine-protein phosphatase YwqE